mgnify:CR=1 FL=1
MNPVIGRVAFTLAIILLLLSVIPLFFLNPNSGEFIVSTIALLFSLTFLILVIWDVRKQVKRTAV